MHFHVQQLVQQHGYVGVFFILLMDMVGIPFPAETTLILSGIELSKGIFSLMPLWAAAFLGHISGSTIAYGIGRILGRSVITSFGKYAGITPHRFERAEKKFQENRTVLIFLFKYVAGIRILIPYLSGINRMPVLSFFIYNSLSALLWTVTFILLGSNTSTVWHRYSYLLHRYSSAVVFLIGAILLCYFYMTRKNSTKNTLCNKNG